MKTKVLRCIPRTVVVWKLAELVKVSFPDVDIKRMWYMIDPESAEEWVMLEYMLSNSEYNALYSYRINVTADSNTALIDDVWKALKEKFA